jgi:hypothetical protein
VATAWSARRAPPASCLSVSGSRGIRGTSWMQSE